MTDVLIKRGKLDPETDVHGGKVMGRNTGRIPCKDGGRGWNHAAPSQGTSGATRSWKRQGTIRSHRFQRKHGPADTWIWNSSLQNCETMNLSCSRSPRAFQYFVTAATEN